VDVKKGLKKEIDIAESSAAKYARDMDELQKESIP